MTTNTGSRTIFGFLKDYNEKEPWPTMTYQVTKAGGLHANKPVGITHGDATKFLLVETFDRLEVIRHAVAVGWNGPRRFEELEECLARKALLSFKRLIRDRYPDPADKTNMKYEELCMLILTALGDHTCPGNKGCQYMLQKLNYMNFFWADDGHCEKPNDVLRCMWELRETVVAFNTRLGPLESSQTMSSNRPTGISSQMTRTFTLSTQLRPSMWTKSRTTSNVTGNYTSRTKGVDRRQTTTTKTITTRGAGTTTINRCPILPRTTTTRLAKTKVMTMFLLILTTVEVLVTVAEAMTAIVVAVPFRVMRACVMTGVAVA